MGAAREEFLRRSLVAGVASSVVISLTALTVGVAPAIAEPTVVATTTAEAPAQSDQSGSEESSGRGSGRGESSYTEPAVSVEAPAPAVTAAPVPVPVPVPEPAPVQTKAPVQTQAPAPQPVSTPRNTVAPETVAPQPKPEPKPKPEPEPEPEPEPVVEQPTTTTKRPSTQVTTSPKAPAAEPEAAPSSAPSSTPAPSTAVPSTETTEPKTTEPKTAEQTTPSSDATTTTEQPASEDEAKESTEAPESSAAAETSEEATETEGSTQVEPVAKVIETLKPETLDAPAEDVQLALKAAPVEVNPEPAKVEELAQLSSLIGVSNESDRLREERRELREDQRELREDQRELRAEQRDWDNRVRQWSPDWVQYDEFYRPMIVNPYRDPVRIVYEYQNQPRVVTIPPLQRMVMYVADLAAYSFTAVVLNTINTVVSTAVGVAVGSFFGGGFIPNIANIGNFAPPPPPPLFRYDNVPVQVRYSDAVYEPFRVQRIVDVGDDARYGERRVLLDGVTPAWGVWKQNASGERQFEVHRTQQYPGLDTPREGPLPGDYRMTLASEEVPSSTGSGQTALIIAAIACAVLSLGAVGVAGLMGRRRRL